MIYLGIPHKEKNAIVCRYCAQYDIEKVKVFSPKRFVWEQCGDEEIIEYTNIILYKYFYRLLQEIDNRTLVIVNECLRTQNRYDLTYNCLRQYLYQAGHQLIFQYLPLIDGEEDAYILTDWDTKSRWKKTRDPIILRRAQWHVREIPLAFWQQAIHASSRLTAKYEQQKAELFRQVETSLKDPEILPRQLLLVAGGEKVCHIQADRWYLARNIRLKIPCCQTYKDLDYKHSPYTIFEWCHNFLDMSDVMSLSGQSAFDVLMTDLPVERWYWQRYQDWKERIEHVYTTIRQQQERA